MSVVKAIGYGSSTQRFIEREFKKDAQSHTCARACKRCDRKLYQAILDHYTNEMPRDKRLCVECAGLKDNFKPKMKKEDAWLL